MLVAVSDRVPHEAAHVVIGREDVAEALASWRERVAPGQRRIHQWPGPDAFAQRFPELVSAIMPVPTRRRSRRATDTRHCAGNRQPGRTAAISVRRGGLAGTRLCARGGADLAIAVRNENLRPPRRLRLSCAGGVTATTFCRPLDTVTTAFVA